MQKLLKQYKAIKAKYQDAILLFRVGDYYALLNGDALLASEVLKLELTSSEQEEEIKYLLSFPHYALDHHLHQLVRKGHKVAVCEQLEDPKTCTGNVSRGVTDLF